MDTVRRKRPPPFPQKIYSHIKKELCFHLVQGSRGGFAATIPMTIHAALFSPSFLWKEVHRRGGGWPRETVLPHSRKPTPPRFARPPLPKEGARMIFQETLITSLPFAVRDSRFPTYAAHYSAFLSCLSCRLCPIRPYGAPSPRGEG